MSVSGELELCFDDAERIKTLVPIARMFIAGDGELEERLDAALRIAESIAGASTLVARELGALRRAWSESTLAIPLADLELEADMILVGQRRPRSLEIFHGKHIVTRLHTPLHACAVPIYLPEAALADLPLERRFNAQLFVELNPRRVATEESRLAGAALAVARLID
ncbi:MAG: hypothetical protein JNK04_06160 [Myxococcales bacterium]|nr:hypothetical protein [Myxococcales bacterium]